MISSAPVCPWPQIMLFDNSVPDQLARQLFSVRYRYSRSPLWPGWTLKDPTGTDRTVIRYDDEHGNFWLWHINGDRTPDGYLIAKWRD